MMETGERNMRHRMLRLKAEHEERRLSRPVVVAIGFHDYDQLKAEVQSSVAETVPGYAPASLEFSGLNPIGLMHALNCAGVECFYWQGLIVTRIQNSAVTGTFFL
jgi:hypothetical protein